MILLLLYYEFQIISARPKQIFKAETKPRRNFLPLSSFVENEKDTLLNVNFKFVLYTYIEKYHKYLFTNTQIDPKDQSTCMYVDVFVFNKSKILFKHYLKNI